MSLGVRPVSAKQLSGGGFGDRLELKERMAPSFANVLEAPGAGTEMESFVQVDSTEARREVARKIIAQGGPVAYTAHDIAWMEAHPTAAQLVRSVMLDYPLGVLLGVGPVLGYVFGEWPGCVAGVVISLFIFAYTRSYVSGQTGLVSWLRICHVIMASIQSSPGRGSSE
jgi:hypothetical protein